MEFLGILQTILFLCVSFGAGFVQRVSGFGLGIFAMLFFPYLFPSHTAAAAISCLFSCGTSSYNAVKYRRNIPFKTVLPVAVGAFIVIPFAVILSKYVTKAFFERLLGTVLILLGIYFLFINRRMKIRPTVVNGLVAGGLGGMLNGLFSTGGPPVVLFMTHATASNLAYFSGIQFYFAVTNIYSTVCRAINGVLTPQVLFYAFIGFLACMTGDQVGRRIFDKLDGAKLKRIIYIGMMVSGVIMLI